MEKELIKFEKTESSIPFIRVKHNNIEFNLVVDTGCTTSCIDENILELLVHTKTGEQTPGIIYANGEDSGAAEIVKVPLTVGNKTFDEEFNVVDLHNMASQVKDSFGITIRGLLGSEFLYKNQLILDFNKCLIRYNERQTSIDF